jgi:hypothetical protein
MCTNACLDGDMIALLVLASGGCDGGEDSGTRGVDKNAPYKTRRLSA